MAPPYWKQVTVLAPGLLGASVAMALRARDLAGRVVVWARRAETRRLCENLPWCDAVAETPEAAAVDANLVVVCSPVGAVVELVQRVAPACPAGALITDVGSVKGRICRSLEGTLPESVEFVGGHPMAGSEKLGMEYGRADLFVRRACFCTPVESSTPEAVEGVKGFWEALGMRVFRCSPEEHDRLVARVSHLPHVLASVLAGHLGALPGQLTEVAGPGLKDTTRVAAGDPDLWMGILMENREPVLDALDGFTTSLLDFRNLLEAGDVVALQERLNAGKVFRDLL